MSAVQLRLRLTVDLVHNPDDHGADGRSVHPQDLCGRNALAKHEYGFARARAGRVDGKQGVIHVGPVGPDGLYHHEFRGVVGRMLQRGNNASDDSGENHGTR